MTTSCRCVRVCVREAIRHATPRKQPAWLPEVADRATEEPDA